MRRMSFAKPTEERRRRFIQAQAPLDFSYKAVGATATKPPDGYAVDHTRVLLGTGEAVFNAAKRALQAWRHFDLGWVDAWPTTTPLKAGEVVSVLARANGLWWLNCCRIVYVVDEAGPIRRFGFAYGTLPGHIESGEERFMIEWDSRDQSVWYDILAFSKPNHILLHLAYPLLRRTQKRFARDSATAIRRAVGECEGAEVN